MTVPKPRWFSRDQVMVSTAPTVGISKSGGLLVKFDPATGRRLDAIDDRLLEDMEALRDGRQSETLQLVPTDRLSLRHAVPIYYDRRFHDQFLASLHETEFAGFSSATLRQLAESRRVALRGGHGSAPKDLRVGEVPYIKVSDLRAGLVNINPTNRVPLKYAEGLWGGPSSGLQAFDLLSPERASRNIGDFCVLMPGQEQILLTKEVIVLRPGDAADFDQFYLLWAMTLKTVRDQWHRVVFMQTNREDVGQRYLEIEIPVAPDRSAADRVSEPFRRYFTALAREREELVAYLNASGRHHFFVSGAEAPAIEEEAVVDVPAAELVD